MSCDYKREDKIRAVVSKGLLVLLWVVIIGVLGIVTWTEPVFVIGSVLVIILIMSVIAVGLWLSGDIDFCERPPEETPTPEDYTDDE